jgi:hypothetical protein
MDLRLGTIVACDYLPSTFGAEVTVSQSLSLCRDGFAPIRRPSWV